MRRNPGPSQFSQIKPNQTKSSQIKPWAAFQRAKDHGTGGGTFAPGDPVRRSPGTLAAPPHRLVRGEDAESSHLAAKRLAVRFVVRAQGGATEGAELLLGAFG